MKKISDKKRETCCDTILNYSKAKTCTVDYDAIRATCEKCGKIWEQNLLTNAVYYAEDGKQFKHYNCGEEIDCVWRLHSCWDKSMTCAGDGSVDKYPIPYCPVHEEKPSEQGMPVYY